MSTADEIAKLHQLVEKGALTQAEFEQLKARLLSELPGPGAGLAINRLRRSLADRWIAGVCGGIAEYAGIDANLVRLLAVVGAFVAFPAVVVGYIIAWVLLPER